MVYLERWNAYYKRLKEYCDKYGTANVPADYVTEDDYRLGAWVIYQRARFRNRMISKEQKNLLDSINMVWRLNDNKWDTMYDKLLEYYDKNGNIDISLNYITEDGCHLGEWLGSLKQAYKGKSKRKINHDQIAMLNDLYVDWANHDTRILNSEIVKGCCFNKYKKVMLERMKHILEDMSYEVEGNITNINKQKYLEEEIIGRMWR